MDMKRILQALDGASTKPVEGASAMSKFLSIVKETDLNQPAAAPAPAASTLSAEQLAYNKLRAQLDSADALRGGGAYTDVSPEVTASTNAMRTKLAQMAAALKAKGIDAEAEYDAPDPAVPAQAPVDLNQKYNEDIGMAGILSIINEGANPHKVSLPVQMAMQHYQQPVTEKKQPKTSLISKYFVEAEESINQEAAEKKQLINQYAHTIAQRVLMKESALKDKDDLKAKRKALQDIQLDPETSKDPELKAELIRRKHALEKEAKEKNLKESGEAGWGRTGMAGVGLQPVEEVPIEPSGDPNDPTVYGHQKANPMSLKGRIMQARKQLKELAQLAEADDLATWQHICKLAKGGMFMGLEQNLEQVRHGIEELAAKRKKGGIASRGIDKNIGEDNDPCWKDYKQIGTKKKGGKTVPNCVPKE